MNNSDDYVMKSSKTMLEMALKMDQNGGDDLMKDVDVFFDGYHSRCTGFISLGLWFQHPSMRRILRIASMEVRTEKGDTIEMFSHFLMRCCSKWGRRIRIISLIQNTSSMMRQDPILLGSAESLVNSLQQRE